MALALQLVLRRKRNLLQNHEWRMKLRNYIIEHKLTDDFWSVKLVGEGLGTIATLLLSA